MTKCRNQARRERDKARRNSLTTKKREDMNAQRRVARQNKTIDERNARQRQTRRNVSPKERQEMNACRRESWHNIPPEEKQTLLAQRNARLAVIGGTPLTLNPSQCHVRMELLCHPILGIELFAYFII